MGGVGLTGVLRLPDAAVLVSILALINATAMLVKGWREVAWKPYGLMQLGSLLALFVGYALLSAFAAHSLSLLRLLLGLVIIASSIQLLFRPNPLPHPSPALSFAGFGIIAGLMSGLFSTSGPPLVYHMYRQPLRHAVIRETLVAVFAVNSLVRLGAVAASGHLPPPSTWWALVTIPAVLGATYAARRWPPPIGPIAMRRAAFVLLMVSGVSLGLPAAIALVQGI